MAMILALLMLLVLLFDDGVGNLGDDHVAADDVGDLSDGHVLDHAVDVDKCVGDLGDGGAGDVDGDQANIVDVDEDNVNDDVGSLGNYYVDHVDTEDSAVDESVDDTSCDRGD